MSLYSFEVAQLQHFITVTEGTQLCPVSAKTICSLEREQGLFYRDYSGGGYRKLLSEQAALLRKSGESNKVQGRGLQADRQASVKAPRQERKVGVAGACSA